MQKPEWLPQVSINENFSHHYAVGFSHKLWWISSADSPRHTLILLHFIYVRLPSVNRREGWQEMDLGEGKSQGLLSCPSCWLPWGFPTSSCQVLFTIQLSPWSPGLPTPFAFSTAGVTTLPKPPACMTSLASAESLETLSAPNSLFTTLLDCLNESSVSCQDSDIQEF